MTKFKSRKDVYASLEALERKYNIHSIKRDGFPIYQMTKVPIMGNLINETVKNPKSGYAFEKLKNAKAKNTLKIRKKNERNSEFNKKGVMFILRGLYNGDGRDNYIDKYIKYEQKYKKNIYIIDREMGGEYHPHVYDSEYTTKDFQALIKLQKPSYYQLTRQEKDLIVVFSKELEELGYVGNYLRLFEHSLSKFYSEYTLYKCFILRNKIRRVYLSLGYTHLPLIKAAKDLNIETIEVQYGNISPMHGGFGSWNKSEIYSDILGVWSDFYANLLDSNPSRKVRIIPSNLVYKNIVKKEQLLVVVQRLEIDAFIKLAKTLRVANPNLKIIYKFHPFHDISSKIKTELGQLKIELIIDEISSEILINESKWVLSGYSTALIEANYANSIPLVSREIPYSDEFIPFCEQNYMHIYINDEIKKYKQCKALSKDESEFYPKN